MTFQVVSSLYFLAFRFYLLFIKSVAVRSYYFPERLFSLQKGRGV